MFMIMSKFLKDWVHKDSLFLLLLCSFKDLKNVGELQKTRLHWILWVYLKSPDDEVSPVCSAFCYRTGCRVQSPPKRC